MSDLEKTILDLEAQFPAMAGEAFAAARKRVLQSGQSVLISEAGAIYEMSPNGQRRLIEKIECPIPVKPGSKFIIR